MSDDPRELHAFSVQGRTLTAQRRPPRATLALAYTGHRLLAGLIDLVPILGITAALYAVGLGIHALIPEDPAFWPEHVADLYNTAPATLARPLIAPVIATTTWMLLTGAVFGRSLGKRVMRLEAVDARGMPLGAARLIGRALACGLSVATLGLGWLLSLILPSRRALHDLICDTYVVLTGEEAERLAAQTRSSKTAANTSRVQA